ncbi:response regulator transcription factor [Bacillus sp. ISL-40]|nr:response regulator transcription factor [Bacillus sp. ISL-40]MBT2719796.1 response regulator transcription factor [Bacillus sp. ISL-46]MBT2742477.1 response regulator transcription factor [Bacillus sp. ISL-77]
MDVDAWILWKRDNKEIAQSLFISDKTVKIHVSNLFKKLGVKSRSQVVQMLIEKGNGM